MMDDARKGLSVDAKPFCPVSASTFSVHSGVDNSDMQQQPQYRRHHHQHHNTRSGPRHNHHHHGHHHHHHSQQHHYSMGRGGNFHSQHSTHSNPHRGMDTTAAGGGGGQWHVQQGNSTPIMNQTHPNQQTSAPPAPHSGGGAGATAGDAVALTLTPAHFDGEGKMVYPARVSLVQNPTLQKMIAERDLRVGFRVCSASNRRPEWPGANWYHPLHATFPNGALVMAATPQAALEESTGLLPASRFLNPDHHSFRNGSIGFAAAVINNSADTSASREPLPTYGVYNPFAEQRDEEVVNSTDSLAAMFGQSKQAKATAADLDDGEMDDFKILNLVEKAKRDEALSVVQSTTPTAPAVAGGHATPKSLLPASMGADIDVGAAPLREPIGQSVASQQPQQQQTRRQRANTPPHRSNANLQRIGFVPPPPSTAQELPPPPYSGVISGALVMATAPGSRGMAKVSAFILPAQKTETVTQDNSATPSSGQAAKDNEPALQDEEAEDRVPSSLVVNAESFFSQGQQSSASEHPKEGYRLQALQGVRTANGVPLQQLTWERVFFRDSETWMPPPMIPDGGAHPSSDTLNHFTSVHPSTHPGVSVSLYYYRCNFCSPSAYPGKINDRPADVKLGGICGDVPALCIAHLVEVISGVRIQAIDMFGNTLGRCNLWLQDPNDVPMITAKLHRRMWMSPVYLGYAVVADDEDAREYLLWYLEGLRIHGPKCVRFPRHLVTCERWLT